MASPDAEKVEAKQEGVIETASELAQDPQSHVNSEKIEEKLVEETKESGVPAYQFDPNAAPEEKAAAAESVCSRECRASATDNPNGWRANPCPSDCRPIFTTRRSPRAFQS